MKIGFLRLSDGLAPLGVKARIFIHEKSDHLSRLGMLLPNIQQGLLGTGHVWLPDWWSAWPYCLGQLFWAVFTAPTPEARPWQLQYVLVNCVVSLPAVTVQDVICQMLSYDERGMHVCSSQQVVELFGLNHDLFDQLATWSTVSLKSPKLARAGCSGTPISQSVQYERRPN